MNPHSKYLLRVASAIQATLLRQPDPRLAEAGAALARLCGQLDHLKQAARKLAICRERGWNLAGQQLLEDLRYTVQDLSGEAARSEWAVQDPAEPAPTLRQLYQEITQAEQEFDEFEYRRDAGVLVVTTGPIVLEDIRLGRFEIQLIVNRLGSRNYPDVLRIVALEPNPASSDERVTHPHVSSEGLCAGEASAALRAALVSGRICDVFLLARSVLENYNSGSPFVSLENWDGTKCSDCGYCVSPDETFYCEGCEQDYCESCVTYCRSCDTNLCHSCLNKCPLCNEYVCAGCLQVCHGCHARACQACLDDNLCPTCIKKEKHDEQRNDDDQQTTATGPAAQVVAVGLQAATATGPALQPDRLGQAGVLPRPRRHRNRRVRRRSVR